MKSPEEIKDGLKCCYITEGTLECRDCPYICNGYECVNILAKDALAYIYQLENKIADLDKLASSRLRKMKLFKKRAEKYLAECVQLRNRVKKLEEQMTKWIRVEAQLPEDGASYLCHFSEGQDVVCVYYGDGKWLTMDWEDVTRFVTHWMLLPKAPREDYNG